MLQLSFHSPITLPQPFRVITASSDGFNESQPNRRGAWAGPSNSPVFLCCSQAQCSHLRVPPAGEVQAAVFHTTFTFSKCQQRLGAGAREDLGLSV